MKSSRQSDAVLSVGEVAERFGLATHVLRHWESMGLLSPARDAGAQRRYDASDLVRIATILRAKEAGLGLESIREMIHAREPGARSAVLRRQHAELSRRLAAIQGSLELIECALDCDHEDIAECPRIQDLIAERIRQIGGHPSRA